MVPSETPEQSVRQELPEPLDHQEQWVAVVPPAVLGHWARLVQGDRTADQAVKRLQAHLVRPVRRVCKVLPVQLVLLELREVVARPELRVNLASPGSQDRQDSWVH